MGLEDLLDFGETGEPDLPELDVSEVDFVDGEGHLLDPFWQDQEADGLCAPTSAAIVMSFISGQFHDKDEIAEKAIELGLLEPLPDGSFSGMTLYDLEHLMEYYNVDGDVQHGTFEQLQRALDQGSQVIVAADSDEVWFAGVNDDGSPTDRMADHALVVAGIDESRGVVILSDPGNPDVGQGYEMTLADFRNAWADSGNEMLVTEPDRDGVPPTQPPSGPSQPQQHPAATGSGEHGGDGLAAIAGTAAALIVPLTIAGRMIRRVRLKRSRSGGK
jgi:hypothetical protein